MEGSHGVLIWENTREKPKVFTPPKFAHINYDELTGSYLAILGIAKSSNSYQDNITTNGIMNRVMLLSQEDFHH